MPRTPVEAAASLEAAIDALYQAPLDRFTADRNALAAAVKKAGDTAAAERVKALAKPSVTAWAVNQAWWKDQAAFRAMLAAGDQQRAAHVAWSSGRNADVRAAAEARRKTVDVVADQAIAVLGGPGAVAADARYRIAGTLEALSSRGVPEDATPGRLVRDLQASGFEALGSLAATAGPAPARAPGQKTPAWTPTVVARGSPNAASPAVLTEAPRTKAQQKAREKAEAAARARAERLAEAQTRLAEAEAALTTAERSQAERAAEESRATVAARAAQTRTVELEEALDRAREDERAARRALTQATTAASEAELVRARTAREVVRAREQLKGLKG